MARRLATVGYYVLLPNLYYRAGRDTIYGPQVLEHGSPERCGRKAGREALDQPGKHQPLDTPSREKEHEGDALKRQRR